MLCGLYHCQFPGVDGVLHLCYHQGKLGEREMRPSCVYILQCISNYSTIKTKTKQPTSHRKIIKKLIHVLLLHISFMALVDVNEDI